MNDFEIRGERKMGYLNFAGLSRFLGKITERLNGKVNIHQGDENEDCYLAVDANGDLALRDVPITLGIPAEWDRLGFVSINDANATQDVFTVRFEEEGAEFEPDCTYAGSAHLYGADVEYVSDIDLAMYVETLSGTDRLVFYNHVLMPGGIFFFIWEVDLTQGFVRVVFSTSDRTATIESLFSSGTLSQLDFIIRKVQKEPW